MHLQSSDECAQTIQNGSTEKVRWLSVKLKCFYTNACSVGSYQEELESCHLTTTGALRLMVRNCLGGPGKEGMVEMLSSALKNGLIVFWMDFFETAAHRSRAYG